MAHNSLRHTVFNNIYKTKAKYFCIYLHHLIRRSKALNWLMHRYCNELLSYLKRLTYCCYSELWSYFSKINVLLVGLRHTDKIHYKVSPPPSPPPPQCSYHAEGPPAVDPFQSHTNKSFFNGLPAIPLPSGV